MMLNSHNSFLKRLLLEEALLESESIMLVKDANQILDEHYLVFTKDDFDSFADVIHEEYIFFIENFLKNSILKNFITIERGRHLSCCQEKKVIHAHAHLIPSKFLNNVLNIIKDLELENIAFGTLENLLKIAKEMTPYLLIHDNNLNAYLFKISENHRSVVRYIIMKATKE